MAEYWPSSLFAFLWTETKSSFCVFMDRDEVEVHKNAKRELGQYSAILTSRLVNNIYIYLTIRLRARVFYEQIVNEAQPS